MRILMKFLGFGAKSQGGWSNSQGKNRRADPLCLLELFGSPFNLAKFHSNWRDGMYYSCMVLWHSYAMTTLDWHLSLQIT